MASGLAVFINSYRGFHKDTRRFVYSSIFEALGAAMVHFLYSIYLFKLYDSWVIVGVAIGLMQGSMTIPLLLGGWLGDRFGRKRVVILGIGISVAGVLAIAASPSLFNLLLGGALWGLGHAVYRPSFMAFLSQKVGEARRKFLFSFQSFAVMLASGIMTMVVGVMFTLFIDVYGWDDFTAISRIVLVALVFLVLQMIPLLSVKDESTREAAGKRRKLGAKVKPKKITSPIPRRTLLLLAMPMILLGIGAGLIVPFFSVYFIARFDTPISSISYLFGLTYILWALAYLLIPHLAERIGSVRAITLVQSAAILALVGIPISPSFGFVAAMYTTRMVLMNSNWPIMQSYSLSQVPDEHRSFTLATTQFAFDAPKSLTPFIAGFIFLLSLEMPFYICAVFYSLATAMFFILFRKKDDKLGLFSEKDTS